MDLGGREERECKWQGRIRYQRRQGRSAESGRNLGHGGAIENKPDLLQIPS